MYAIKTYKMLSCILTPHPLNNNVLDRADLVVNTRGTPLAFIPEQSRSLVSHVVAEVIELAVTGTHALDSVRARSGHLAPPGCDFCTV